MSKHPFASGSIALIALLLIWGVSSPILASEVGKGAIPAEQLTNSYKQLPWGCPVWDEAEAIEALLKGDNQLWVDTRPESFFKAGTVRGAVLQPYNQSGKPDNTLTKESLADALKSNGLGPDATIIFFCQGPECHRSYNASFVAVSEWGYQPAQVVWFRAGYPLLLAAVKADAKLKRKAKKLLSDEGMNGL